MKIKLTILFAAILLNIIMNIFGNALKIEYYSLTSDKLTAPVRIVFLSDLHNCTYGGAEQSGLWKEIVNAQPDFVLFGGDVIDFQGGTKHAIQLMKMVKENYPCAYASGNHEVMRDDTEEFYDAVASLGIPVLHGAYSDITVHEQKIRLCGIVNVYDNPDQLESACQSPADDRYNVLLLHQPEQLDEVVNEAKNSAFDLVLSGHAHGGQWRIPEVLEQGLYAPDQGIFPEFTNGQRKSGSTVQIVSRGLAKPLRMFIIPRIFNRPEISVVDIAPEPADRSYFSDRLPVWKRCAAGQRSQEEEYRRHRGGSVPY